MQRLAWSYLPFADNEAALWRLMFGVQAAPYRANPGPENTSSSARYLPAALKGLFNTGVVPRAPSDVDVLYAWSAIHGLAMLRAGKIAAALVPLSHLATAFTDHTIEALGGQHSYRHPPHAREVKPLPTRATSPAAPD